MHSDCLADIIEFSCHFKETLTVHCRQYFNGHDMPIDMEKTIAPYKKLTNVHRLFEVKKILKAYVHINLMSLHFKIFLLINQLMDPARLSET